MNPCCQFESGHSQSCPKYKRMPFEELDAKIVEALEKAYERGHKDGNALALRAVEAEEKRVYTQHEPYYPTNAARNALSGGEEGV